MRQLKISKSITSRDTDSIDKYLSEIARIPLITIEEETILAQQIREGNEDALMKLTSANLRFVVSVAKQYQNQGLSLSDLINEGNLGLIKAAKRFDETRGFKFISYAVWWIRQFIMQAVGEHSRIIRIPHNKIGILNKIKRTSALMEQRLERPASNFELADEMEISLVELNNAMNSAQRTFSTDSTVPGNEELTLMDIIYNPNDPKTDELLMKSSLSIDISRTLNTLTEREKDVIVLFYGIDRKGSHTLSEIGLKYDLTRERVRQIKEKAIRRLRNTSRNKILRSYLG